MAQTRQESRVLRPFRGLAQIDKFFEGSRFVLNGLDVAGEVYLDRAVLRTYTLQLIVNVSGRDVPADLRLAGLDVDDCELVVFATGRSLKATQLVNRWPLAHFLTLDQEVSIAFEADVHPLIYRDVDGGLDVVAAVVLCEEKTPRPLTPYVPGTWLAKAQVSLLPNRDFSTFAPKPLNEEVRNRYQVPEGALIYVHVTEAITTSTSIDESVELFVDEMVLGLVQQTPASVVAEALQASWARTVVESLILTASAKANSEELSAVYLAELPGTIWSQIRRNVCRSSKMSALQVASMLITEPQRLISHIDSAAGMTPASARALNEVI